MCCCVNLNVGWWNVNRVVKKLMYPKWFGVLAECIYLSRYIKKVHWFFRCHLFQPVSISKNTYQVGVSIRISIVLTCLSQSLCTLRTTSCGGIREAKPARRLCTTDLVIIGSSLPWFMTRSVHRLVTRNRQKSSVPQIISWNLLGFNCFYSWNTGNYGKSYIFMIFMMKNVMIYLSLNFVMDDVYLW